MLEANVFWLPKEGNGPEEYEDASFSNCDASRFAVADGASDSYDSRRWSKMLVKSFSDGEFIPAAWEPEALDLWLKPLVQQWKAAICWEKLPWYKVEKARIGAFSTFLGIQLEPSNQSSTQNVVLGGRWRAWAVGDACLFHVRGRDLVKPSPFPVKNAADFGVTPALITTDITYNQRSLKKLETVEGDYRQGDVFLLATDALAQWFLRACEADQKPWSRLQGITQTRFAELVAELRQEGTIRNDDVTLLVVHVAAEERNGSEPQSMETSPEISPALDAGPEPAHTSTLSAEALTPVMEVKHRARESTQGIEPYPRLFAKPGLTGRLLFAAGLTEVALLTCWDWLLGASLSLGYLR